MCSLLLDTLLTPADICATENHLYFWQTSFKIYIYLIAVQYAHEGLIAGTGNSAYLRYIRMGI